MLNNKNYFSKENNMKYMSVSQFKAFEHCQAQAFAELNGEYIREKTSALLVGSFVDAYFEETLDLFLKDNHKLLYRRDGSLKTEYQHAWDIIDRVSRDPLFMEYMGGKKQVIYTGEICGVPIKIKVDSMHYDKIVDLKVVKDFAPIFSPEKGKQTFIEAWGYDLQGAVYQEIVRQNTGERLPFYIAAATKEKNIDFDIFEVPQELLDFELSHFEKDVQYYDALKHGVFEPERCETCDYCKQTKVLTGVKKLEVLTDE